MDFILFKFGAWQLRVKVLHYTMKLKRDLTSSSTPPEVLPRFMELNFILDGVTIPVGIALGVLFTDFLYKYFEKPV